MNSKLIITLPFMVILASTASSAIEGLTPNPDTIDNLILELVEAEALETLSQEETDILYNLLDQELSLYDAAADTPLPVSPGTEKAERPKKKSIFNRIGSKIKKKLRDLFGKKKKTIVRDRRAINCKQVLINYPTAEEMKAQEGPEAMCPVLKTIRPLRESEIQALKDCETKANNRVELLLAMCYKTK